MRVNGKWTESKFNSFIKSALRSASVRWEPRYATLHEACIGTQINAKTGRMAKHYQCRKCKGIFPGKEIEVNHITPVIPIEGFDSWDNVINRMFCEQDGFEALCKPCHKEITQQENKERREYAKRTSK